MNLAFTLCSINYLAQAKVLLDSFRATNPDWRFVLGLVDKNSSNIDLSFMNCEVIPLESVEIEGIEDMIAAYSIVEFITAVKPFYFSHLLKTQSEADKIVYFDPDIVVYQPLDDLEKKLDNYDIVLTPHFTKPITDKFLPTEKHIFNTGVFNLGFLAIKRSATAVEMLKWWESKLRHECILDLSRGLFVDQLWMTLVPAYFDNVLHDKYPGYNMAHWNLHERVLTSSANGYLVNGEPLVFFHFSHYNPGRPESIAAFHTRFSFVTRPDLVDLFSTYREALLANGYVELKKVPCYYMRHEGRKRWKRNLQTFFRNNLPVAIRGRLKPLLKLA